MRERAWKELQGRMAELRDLGGISGLLNWDQETYMPPGGAAARGRRLATIQSLFHERLTAPELGEAMTTLEGEEDLGEDRNAMLRNLRWQRERAIRVPMELVRELARAQSEAVEAWREAREENRFDRFVPHLERLLSLRREQADAIGHESERYDALLDGYEPGMRVARLEPIFETLQAELSPLLQTLVDAVGPRRWEFERHRFPAETQWAYTMGLLEDLGFDLERGRQDRSTHPFTSASSRDDVRLTTRISEENPFSAIFGTIHEVGHGLYEQNLPAEHMLDPIGHAASMGLHESQSRLWENLVGRSFAFWEHQLPKLRALFPEALEGVTPAEVYAAVNRVSRSQIRVEADEVSYNLHILLRFRLELALLRDQLQVAELPGAWRELAKKLIGVEPASDREGVLQDIHWAWGEFGYFPTYSLGNLYSAVIFEKLAADLGDVEGVIRSGALTRIRDWLAEHIHRQGHRWDAEEIVRRATGSGLSPEPFLRYLRRKYGELYDVRL